MAFLYILLLIVFLLALARMVTVLTHELGHALAGLILFKEGVTVYVGSYGNPNEGIQVKLGRLKVYFKYNPLLWSHGVCMSDTQEMSYWKGYLFVLAGPMASLLMIFVSFYFLIFTDTLGALKLIFVFLLFSSIQDFFRNLIPDDSPIALYDGRITYNDGQSLKMLRACKHFYQELSGLRQYYNTGEIEKGIAYFKENYTKKPDINILRTGLALYLRGGNYPAVKSLFEELKQMGEVRAEDLGDYALAFSYSGEHDKALEIYNQALSLNPIAFYVLINRGYTYIVLEKYQDALSDFNKALSLNPNYAYAFSNRGLAKIKLGQPEEGLRDIHTAIKLDSKDPYAYKNLGIHHKDQGNFKEALGFLQKAKNLDPNTNGIEDLIGEVEIQLKNHG